MVVRIRLGVQTRNVFVGYSEMRCEGVNLGRADIDDRLAATIGASCAIGLGLNFVCKDAEGLERVMMRDKVPAECEVLCLARFSPATYFGQIRDHVRGLYSTSR